MLTANFAEQREVGHVARANSKNVRVTGDHLDVARIEDLRHDWRSYFENRRTHNRFAFDDYFIEADGRLIDIEEDAIKLDGLPTPPEGMKISHVDIVVRLVKS